jgi:hypothetical protein
MQITLSRFHALPSQEYRCCNSNAQGNVNGRQIVRSSGLQATESACFSDKGVMKSRTGQAC